MISYGVPIPFTNAERVKYDAASDTLYVAGYTNTHPQSPSEADFGLAGTEIVRYDQWKAGNRTAHVRITLPYDLSGRYVKSIAVAGQKIFAGMLRTSQTESVYVYDNNTGATLGSLLASPQLGPSISGWIDGVEEIQAYRRSTGEYLVFVEDDLWSKVLMYRFTDPGEVAAYNRTLTFQYSNPNGAAYFNGAYMLINGSLRPSNGCFVLWDKASNGFYLVNDAGTALSGPLTAANLSNAQCMLKFAGTQAATSGTQLTIELALTFNNPPVVGEQQVWMYAYDAGGNTTGWLQNGTITLP
jgi:hypothetical protein